MLTTMRMTNEFHVDDSIYRRLGGKEWISKFSNSWLWNLFRDGGQNGVGVTKMDAPGSACGGDYISLNF